MFETGPLPCLPYLPSPSHTFAGRRLGHGSSQSKHPSKKRNTKGPKLWRTLLCPHRFSGSKATQDKGLTVVPISTSVCWPPGSLSTCGSSQLFSLHPYPARWWASLCPAPYPAHWWASLSPAPYFYITCHFTHALSGPLCHLPFSLSPLPCSSHSLVQSAGHVYCFLSLLWTPPDVSSCILSHIYNKTYASPTAESRLLLALYTC